MAKNHGQVKIVAFDSTYMHIIIARIYILLRHEAIKGHSRYISETNPIASFAQAIYGH